jgi:guanylate kinase
VSAPGPFLVVLSGPSGVGKSTVAERLLADPAFGRAVTATTRAPRPGEADGVAYHFLTEAAFRERLAQGGFLEHANVYGRLYGTPASSVEAVLASGRVCVLVIDVQGAATLRDLRTAGRLPCDVRDIFLDAPEDVLRQRLRVRGTESADEAERRWRTGVQAERAQRGAFDAVVVNEDLDRTVAEIKMLVSHWRSRA